MIETSDLGKQLQPDKTLLQGIHFIVMDRI
jgi:hypothetical protein